MTYRIKIKLGVATEQEKEFKEKLDKAYDEVPEKMKPFVRRTGLYIKKWHSLPPEFKLKIGYINGAP